MYQVWKVLLENRSRFTMYKILICSLLTEGYTVEPNAVSEVPVRFEFGKNITWSFWVTHSGDLWAYSMHKCIPIRVVNVQLYSCNVCCRMNIVPWFKQVLFSRRNTMILDVSIGSGKEMLLLTPGPFFLRDISETYMCNRSTNYIINFKCIRENKTIVKRTKQPKYLGRNTYQRILPMNTFLH